jgi:uncharacterized membrane protein (DUF485 family)
MTVLLVMMALLVMIVQPVMTGLLVMMARRAMIAQPVTTAHVMIGLLVMMARRAMIAQPVTTAHVMIGLLVMIVQPVMTAHVMTARRGLSAAIVLTAHQEATDLPVRVVTTAPPVSLLMTGSLAPSAHRAMVLATVRRAPNRESVLIPATGVGPRATPVRVTPIPARTAPLSVPVTTAPK